MTGFHFTNRATAVVIALFAIGYLALALQLPDFVGVNVSVQPATLPRWLGAVLLALAVALFWQRTETDGDTPAALDAPAAPDRLGRLSDPRWEVALFAGSAGAYVALFAPLGFVLATAVYLGAMTWYLGYRRHAVTVLVSLGVAVGLYLGMTQGLDVALPTGPLPL